jgi:hypothetical protein
MGNMHANSSAKTEPEILPIFNVPLLADGGLLPVTRLYFPISLPQLRPFLQRLPWCLRGINRRDAREINLKSGLAETWQGGKTKQ